MVGHLGRGKYVYTIGGTSRVVGIHRDVATIVAASGYTYYIEISDILYSRCSGYGCVWPSGTPWDSLGIHRDLGHRT